MITGRDEIVEAATEEGVKRRNQRLCVEFTMTSDEETPLMDLELGFGGSFQSRSERRRRLMVPLERRVISQIVERMDIEERTFHGRLGFEVEDMVLWLLTTFVW